jgi:hypothetical protein
MWPRALSTVSHGSSVARRLTLRYTEDHARAFVRVNHNARCLRLARENSVYESSFHENSASAPMEPMRGELKREIRRGGDLHVDGFAVLLYPLGSSGKYLSAR